MLAPDARFSWLQQSVLDLCLSNFVTEPFLQLAESMTCEWWMRWRIGWIPIMLAFAAAERDDIVMLQRQFPTAEGSMTSQSDGSPAKSVVFYNLFAKEWKGHKWFPAKCLKMFNSPNLTKLWMICACWKSKDMCHVHKKFLDSRAQDAADVPRVAELVRDQLSRLDPEHQELRINMIGAITGISMLGLNATLAEKATSHHYEEGNEDVTLHDIWSYCQTAQPSQVSFCGISQGPCGKPWRYIMIILWYTIFMIMILMSYNVLYTYIHICINMYHIM